MNVILNDIEVRVLGAMVEKKITTPDYYPLTLNALTNACNQKSSRDPVVSFDEQTVVRALDSLREKKLTWVITGADHRVPKYGHLFNEAFDLEPPEAAVLCVLMLRGAQTPGEVRGRSAPLYNFESLAEVETTLQGLVDRDRPLVARLPRHQGFKESRYAHLLAGEVEVEERAAPPPRHEPATLAVRAENERVAQLETELETLRREVRELKEQLSDFRKQFE